MTFASRGRTAIENINAMDYLKQIKLFTTFSQLFETKNDHNVKIENAIFKLHSQWTVMILMVGTMFLSMRQYFGEPIECLTRSDISPTLLQHYCWIEAAFSVADSETGKAVVGNEVAYPGVKTLNENAGEKKQYHKYYQWVYFVLIIQAIMFYIPKYLWKAKEAKRLKNLIYILTQRHIMEWNESESRKIAQDVFDSILISSDYFFFFFFCEFLYYIHLIMQMWFVNVFLSGQFIKLGWEWLLYSHNDNKYSDPLIRVFPRMTKCQFHKYGYSGSIERHDALCFLPLNIVNEKVYVLLWFWFAFLFVVTSLGLINRIFIVLFHRFRYVKLRKIAPSADKKYLKRLTTRVGNWFILYHIANNMKPSYFRDLIEYLVKEHFDKNCNLIISNKKVDNLNINNQQRPNAVQGMGQMPGMNNMNMNNMNMNNMNQMNNMNNMNMNNVNNMNNMNMNMNQMNNMNNMVVMPGMAGMPKGMNTNKMMMMGQNVQMVSAPSAPLQTNTNTGNKKKGNKSAMKNTYYVCGNKKGKPVNFVSVNRDPPSGHSADSDECSTNNLG